MRWSSERSGGSVRVELAKLHTSLAVAQWQHLLRCRLSSPFPRRTGSSGWTTERVAPCDFQPCGWRASALSVSQGEPSDNAARHPRSNAWSPLVKRAARRGEQQGKTS